MLTAFIHNIQTADNLLRSASALARDLKKELGVLCYADNENRANEQRKNIEQYFAENGIENARLLVKTHPEKMLAATSGSHSSHNGLPRGTNGKPMAAPCRSYNAASWYRRSGRSSQISHPSCVALRIWRRALAL